MTEVCPTDQASALAIGNPITSRVTHASAKNRRSCESQIFASVRLLSESEALLMRLRIGRTGLNTFMLQVKRAGHQRDMRASNITSTVLVMFENLSVTSCKSLTNLTMTSQLQALCQQASATHVPMYLFPCIFRKRIIEGTFTSSLFSH